MERNNQHLSLEILPLTLAVCRLAPDEPLPEWVDTSRFLSITRTENELSIVCETDHIPVGLNCEPGWRALKVAGSLDFSLIGILASLLTPLAQAGISVFAISTFDTDYLLVKQTRLMETVTALRSVGHQIVDLGLFD